MQAQDAVLTILQVLGQHAQRAPESLDRNEELVDLGIDSLKFIVVVLEIEQLLNRHIFNIENVGKLRTVGDMLALAEAPMPA